MKEFMGPDFLLNNNTSIRLYEKYAKNMPILDYHCHINPQEIAEDRKFTNITEVWLDGDHYKWRLMRANGIPEEYITGNAPDREKFQRWAQTLEKAIGNPLYHWSHLELKRYFGYHGILNDSTAQEVWTLCNNKLKEENMSVRGLIKQSNVTLICTTDDPVDSLKWHKIIAVDSTFDVSVLPTWRPDKAMNIEKPDFVDYLNKLSKASGITISTVKELKAALINRLDYFASHGCSLSDHGLDYVMHCPVSDEDVELIFKKRLSGAKITKTEELAFKTALMLFMGREYHKRNWAMQLHYSCKRNNNTEMFGKLGSDTGFDSIENSAPAAQLADFLDALAKTGELPRTIIYSLNPTDDAVIGTIIGCFQNSDAIGKIQHGSAWWFNDHKEGMKNQMRSFANLGLLGNFIGMLTDSRSFLSYARHEYFRRILCNLIGKLVEEGEYPNDEKSLKSIIEDISYNNAVRYFRFSSPLSRNI